MSLLDALFRQSGTELVVSTTPITGDATIDPGYLYELDGGASTLTLTMRSLTLEQIIGKRFAIKVLDGDAGDLVVAVPGGTQIENETGALASSTTIADGLVPGVYREWLCAFDGKWLLVTPPPPDAAVPDAVRFDTGDPIPLGARPTTGQSLVFDGSEIKGASVAVAVTPVEFSSPPAVANPLDEEFLGTSPPAAFKLFRFPTSGANGVLVTPATPGLLDYGIAAAADSAMYNHPRARSKVVLDLVSGGDGFFYGRKEVSLATAVQYWMRFQMYYFPGNMVREGTGYLVWFRDNAGVPTLTGGGPYGHGAVSFAGNRGIDFIGANAGYKGNTFGNADTAPAVNVEFGIVKSATDWRRLVRSETQNAAYQDGTGGGTPITAGSTIWVGLWMPFGNRRFVAIDYLRQIDDGVYI